jgi:hypothetical protein
VSKFKEMCQARVQCTKRWGEYRERSYRNLATIAVGLRDYCEIPQACFSYSPLDKEPEEGMRYAIVGAIHFDGADNYWHLGVVIALTEAPSPFMQSRALLEIALREQAGKVLVKLGRNGTPREIDLTSEKQCAEFYDIIVGVVKQYYERDPDGALDDGSSLSRIGFTSA